MGEGITGIVVAAKTLDSAPDSRQCSEEAQKARV
jgi:hypothetical protein